ncbi:adenosylcobinamide-GDP ribazoletransferase [Marinobacterium sp. AK62]|uniref:Adenosylcobinamide-GDP ribazoletransferase n=1 Tax=Marinobacterium alkalitolerans TaxID=1542925 RepID=A0ABS3Z6I7_9GAMM|nr:adenosylcobinamide-GDP ribazoletransferase [Marinobacterium alkalitolerans]MBP0047304.1 adenosylcobinamide-GDP ribazoletransferase [Marinobacterium alkalitolerans]
MKGHWQAFLCALQFMTLIPVRLSGLPDAHTQARAVLYYPLAGGLLGALLVLTAQALSGLPEGVAAALLVALWAGLTGGLHLDGLADSADGWMGGLGDRERTLRIMKDPHIGASGALALVVQLLLKWSLVSAMIGGSLLWPLLLAPIVARAGAQVLLVTTAYVRAGGIASHYIAQVSRQPVLMCVLGVSLLLLLSHPIALLLAAAVLYLLRRAMIRRLGGMTGDTLGAGIELLETLILCAFVALPLT